VPGDGSLTDGRAFGDASRRPPRRRDLHPGKFTAPWCYQSPSADSAAPLLEPGAERVVIFHLITEGECFVEMGGEPPMQLSAGDVVLFPQGDAHRMSSAPGLSPPKGARLDVVLSRRPR
jgi:hypothetical protein